MTELRRPAALPRSYHGLEAVVTLFEAVSVVVDRPDCPGGLKLLVLHCEAFVVAVAGGQVAALARGRVRASDGGSRLQQPGLAQKWNSVPLERSFLPPPWCPPIASMLKKPSPSSLRPQAVESPSSVFGNVGAHASGCFIGLTTAAPGTTFAASALSRLRVMPHKEAIMSLISLAPAGDT
eukprot:CAMPEP_0178996568 /NCGR_PEP_ID=MMETSP0795-20121207/8437_1 /TAXON_ID=88552 /ORGANISM="Amoebophrya sp., Strain Ameob2" /LENGTH=179 /DNA_ID=CAMNT_0020688965 /DNA_START=825 /DNA_END=1365 /DNA_ORIENTATION=-